MSTTDELDMQHATVADIAVKFPAAIGVLTQHNLDYCCNGGRRFVAACNNLKLDAGSVWREILAAAETPDTNNRMTFETWDTSFLIDYIVQHHHGYVKQSTIRITELLRKVGSAHAEDSPEVVQVRQAFEQLSEVLLEHMTKEEVIIFPTIRRITESAESSLNSPLLTSILTPLIAMENEHEDAGRVIGQIRSLTNNYTPPLHACPTFQLAWKLLKEFEEDLIQHIHIENNILFPRVKMGV